MHQSLGDSGAQTLNAADAAAAPAELIFMHAGHTAHIGDCAFANDAGGDACGDSDGDGGDGGGYDGGGGGGGGGSGSCGGCGLLLASVGDDNALQVRSATSFFDPHFTLRLYALQRHVFRVAHERTQIFLIVQLHIVAQLTHLIEIRNIHNKLT
jgi:hypothetical protein